MYGDKGPLRYASSNAHTNTEVTIYEFVKFFPEDLPNAAEALINALLPQSFLHIDNEREAVDHELNGYKSPEEAFRKAINKRVNPEMDLYNPTLDERIFGLKKITVDDARKFWTKHYSPANVFVYAVGNISKVVPDLIKVLESVPARENNSSPFLWPQRTFLKEPDLLEVPCLPSPTAKVVVTWSVPITIKNNLEDSIALMFLENILCSTSGPLYSRLRDKYGLCYKCGSSFSTDQTGTDFHVFAQTKYIDERLRIASEIQNLLGVLGQDGLSADDIEQFKKTIKVNRLESVYEFDYNNFLGELKTGHSKEKTWDVADRMTGEFIHKVVKYLIDRPRLISVALPLK